MAKTKRRIRTEQRKNPKRYRPPPPFDVCAEYKGYDHDRDRDICDAVGRRYTDGSGYAFREGVRDVSFWFMTRRSAIAAAKRIKKLRGIKVKVTGQVWP